VVLGRKGKVEVWKANQAFPGFAKKLTRRLVAGKGLLGATTIGYTGEAWSMMEWI